MFGTAADARCSYITLPRVGQNVVCVEGISKDRTRVTEAAERDRQWHSVVALVKRSRLALCQMEGFFCCVF